MVAMSTRPSTLSTLVIPAGKAYPEVGVGSAASALTVVCRMMNIWDRAGWSDMSGGSLLDSLGDLDLALPLSVRES